MSGLPTKIRLHTADADAGYVEQRIGRELYTQLRGAGQVAEFRREALGRAHDRYEQVRQAEAPEAEITGAGLLVLQRGLLAAEDLGALLWALAGDPHWQRFTSYTAYDLDGFYASLATGEQGVESLWVLPSDEAIAEEWELEAKQKAIQHLRDLTAAQLRTDLEIIAASWSARRVIAKNVMHGFSVIPAQLLIEPPGAGVLSGLFDLNLERPFAICMVSERDDGAEKVHTASHLVDLRAGTVAEVRNAGELACSLIESLASAWLFALTTQHAFVLGDGLLSQLSEEQREAIGGLDDAPA